MRLFWVSLIVCVLGSVGASASTVTGNTIDIIGSAQAGLRLIFTPRSTPTFDSDGSLIITQPRGVVTDASGDFSVVLKAGDYNVTINNARDSLIISVPNDDASYNIRDLVTGSLTYTYTNPGVLGQATAVNIIGADGDSVTGGPINFYSYNYGISTNNLLSLPGRAKGLTELVNKNPITDNQHIILHGYAEPGDGGWGIFYPTNTVAGTNTWSRIATATNGWSMDRLWDRQTINVLWFGADRTGSDDAAPKIQAAIDFAEANGGGTVFCPDGTYRLASSIVINGSSVVLGGGGSTTFLVDHTSNYALSILGASTASHITGVHVRNIRIVDAGSKLQRGIEIAYVDDALIENVEISGPEKHGVQVRNAQRLTFSGVYVHNTGEGGVLGHGIGIYPYDGGGASDYDNTSDYVIIDNCTFATVYGNSIDLTRGVGHRITNCRFTSGTTDDSAVINLEGVKRSVVTGCHIVTTPTSGRHGILLRSSTNPNDGTDVVYCEDVTVFGNEATACSGDGFRLINGGTGIKVIGNDFRANTGYGATIAAGTNVVISANHAFGNARGIHVEGSGTKDFVVSANIAEGNTDYDIITISGPSNGDISGNRGTYTRDATTGSGVVSIASDVIRGAQINLGTDSDRIGAIYTDSSIYLNNAFGIIQKSSTGVATTILSLSSGNNLALATPAEGGALQLLTRGAGSVTFGTQAVNRWQVSSSGHLLAVTDNAYDIGASGATRPRNLYTSGGASIGGILTSDNIKRGTGSPEGAVTGNVGDIYIRTDGTPGATLYVKESGTGNTGWAAK